MCICRAVLTALVVLSIALLPVASLNAQAYSVSAPSLHATDCCGDAEPCEKQTRDCGSSVACVLKCSSLPGAIAAPPAVKPVKTALAKPSLLSVDFASPFDNPPLPPPRL
jgi:hypothetical protein